MKGYIGLLGCLLLLVCGPVVQAQAIRKLGDWLSVNSEGRPPLHDQAFARQPLRKKEASEAAALLLADLYQAQAPSLQQAWEKKMLVHDNDTLRFDYRIFGEKPKGGRSLYISMHGGGNTAPRVNDQQWRNQIGLYRPAEGVYVAPRAPTNTWNLWHESHVDTLLDRLILAAVAAEGVDRNKVYIMGYSAGGDGVYQLAPRMADRWAAAAMMAGHPNETSPLGLRNIGFTLHMGALDYGFNRNEVARRWATMLDSLQKLDPGGYRHHVQLHEGRPHWMNREDSVAVPWMAAFRRNPVPEKVVWKQDDMHHHRFYWLAVPAGSAQTGGEIVASYKGNEITIEKNYSDTLLIRLNDAMMNLDRPVTVKQDGAVLFRGRVPRSLLLIRQTAGERLDADLVFSAELVLTKDKKVSVAKP